MMIIRTKSSFIDKYRYKKIKHTHTNIYVYVENKQYKKGCLFFFLIDRKTKFNEYTYKIKIDQKVQ